MKKNRKNRKMIFILLLISFITVTYAASYKIDKSGTLSNVINGLSTSRNKIEDKETFGSAVIAQMLNVNKVTGANAEGGISHLSCLADRKGTGNGCHTFFNGRAVFQHGPHDLCGQRGQNIGLDPAAHTIGQDQDIRILCLDLGNCIAAQFFFFLI